MSYRLRRWPYTRLGLYRFRNYAMVYIVTITKNIYDAGQNKTKATHYFPEKTHRYAPQAQ